MSTHEGSLPMSGEVSMTRQRRLGTLIQPVGMGWKIKNFFQHAYRSVIQDVATEFSGHVLGAVSLKSSLYARVFRPDWAQLTYAQAQKLKQLLHDNVDVRELCSPYHGMVTDYGVVSTRVVTTAGVNFLASAFNNNTTNVGLFKFHGFGTGTNAEAIGDTALQTELTTQYAVDNTRPTGSQSAATNVYTTVGTLSPDSGGTIAITEHGIFSASSGVTLWDRSIFSAVNLVAGSDSLQVTYNLTLTAGG